MSRTVSLVDSVLDRIAVFVAREPMLALFPTSLGVDIFNMEIERFLESESQGVDDREEAEYGRLFDQLEKRVDFANRDHDGQFEFAACFAELKSGPSLRAWPNEAL